MDPIQKLIDWQRRSQDLEKIKEAIRSFRRILEDKFVDALDRKYHKKERGEAPENEGGKEDPKKYWLTNGK